MGAGGLDVVDAFDKEIPRRGLEAPIIEVGCMGLCHGDPFVILYPSLVLFVFIMISATLITDGILNPVL